MAKYPSSSPNKCPAHPGSEEFPWADARLNKRFHSAIVIYMLDLVISQREGEEGIAEIVHLAAEAEVFDKHKALGDHAWLDLVHGGRRGVYGFTAREAGVPHLIGYAQVSVGNGSWALEMVVHPLHRSLDSGVTRSLLKTSVEQIAAAGGGHVHIWLSQRDHDTVEVLREEGFTRGRNLIQMRRRLPLERDLATQSIETRPFKVGVDEEQWLSVNNLAFAQHPEQGGWTRETLASRQQESWFDPNGFLLHFEGERLVGFCWTKVHLDVEPPMGEIYVIGVDPAFGGRGLGKRICVAGLNHLAAKRLPIAMLYVDAENHGAVSMYEHLGFHPDHVDTAYVADIAPASRVRQSSN